MDLKAEHKDLYIQFAGIALQHETLFTARGVDHSPELFYTRIEVPLGWIPLALRSVRRCPASLKTFFKQNKFLCNAILQTLREDVQQARQEVIRRTGLPQIQQYLCHASLGIIKSGAPPQQFHPDWDQDGPPFSQWTLALPITNFPDQGSTEFGSSENAVISYKGSYIWQGHAMHRGGENLSQHTRIVLFLVFLHTEHPSANPSKDDNNPFNNAILP
jgi:hypothetical protein